MLLPGGLMMDWQLEAVFCKQYFSWEFAQMTWAPSAAPGLLRDIERNHNFLYFALPICRMGLVPPHHLCKHLGARERGRWAGVMLTSSCSAEFLGLTHFFSILKKKKKTFCLTSAFLPNYLIEVGVILSGKGTC